MAVGEGARNLWRCRKQEGRSLVDEDDTAALGCRRCRGSGQSRYRGESRVGRFWCGDVDDVVFRRRRQGPGTRRAMPIWRIVVEIGGPRSGHGEPRSVLCCGRMRSKYDRNGQCLCRQMRGHVRPYGRGASGSAGARECGDGRADRKGRREKGTEVRREEEVGAEEVKRERQGDEVEIPSGKREARSSAKGQKMADVVA